MLDIRRIKANLEDIKKAMNRRGEKEFSLDEVVNLDDQRLELLKEVEVLKNKMNVESKKIPQLMKEGKKEEAESEKVNLKKLSDEIKVLDEKIKKVSDELEYKLLRIPNVPNPQVPQGESDEDNVEVRRWGEPITLSCNISSNFNSLSVSSSIILLTGIPVHDPTTSAIVSSSTTLACLYDLFQLFLTESSSS